MAPINFTASLQVIGVWTLLSLIFIFLKNKWTLLKDKFNLYILMAHLFDASSTYIAVDFYAYTEQHVIPSILTGLVGSAIIMFPLKIVVILGSLYIIDSYIADKKIANMLKLAMFILGLAPGLRNFLSLIMGV